MTIKSLLGLDDDRVAELAADRWPTWVSVAPELGHIKDPRNLFFRTDTAAAEPTNEVLLAFARLAAFDGADDHDAALALAWLLVPMAVAARRQASCAGADLDAVVASHLWLEARSVPWGRQHLVRTRVLYRLREALFAECGMSTKRHRLPRLVGAEVDADQSPAAEADPSTASELSELLEWALQADVISDSDYQVLVALLVATNDLDRLGEAPRSNGFAGLTCERVSEAVAQDFGLCARTVRRRATRCVEALEAAVPRFLQEI